VVIFTRDISSPVAKELVEQGADVIKITFAGGDAADGANLKTALQGVDIVVNAIVSREPAAPGINILAKAAVDAGVKVYFSNEFGVDRRLNAFDGFDMLEWSLKADHLNYVKKISKGKNFKIVLLYTGAFLEIVFQSWLGFDFDNRLITTFGSPESQVAYTGKDDIGRSVAQLALLSISPEPGVTASVPEHVRIVGSSRSFTEIKDIVERVYPDRAPIRVESLDLDEQREKLKQDVVSGKVDKENIGGHLRLLWGEGKFDWSAENNNELINPGESLWKWKTVDEFIAEEKAKNKTAQA